MILRITAKLGKAIGVSPSLSLPADPNPFADWTAHLFSALRTPYIIITNTTSLYSLVMDGRGVSTNSLFLQKAMTTMLESLSRDGCRFIFDRLIMPTTAHIWFSKTISRSVTGSMNDLVSQAKLFIRDECLSPPDVSYKLNETPLSYIGYANPRDVFMKLKIE
jgi:hypothetical protein